MRVRALLPTDIPILQQMVKASGYPYPELDESKLEAVRVLVDEGNNPLFCVMIRRLAEAYLICGPPLKPLLQKRAFRLLHEDVATILRQKNYTEVEAFPPPSIAARFGRRLERSFGWTKNWMSWNRRL